MLLEIMHYGMHLAFSGECHVALQNARQAHFTVMSA
jgi:hypothetical protein